MNYWYLGGKERKVGVAGEPEKSNVLHAVQAAEADVKDAARK